MEKMTAQKQIREGTLQFLSIKASCSPEIDCSGGSTVPNMSTTQELSKDCKKLTIKLQLSVDLFNKEQKVVANVEVITRCLFEFDQPLSVKVIHEPALCYPFVTAMYQRTAEKIQREFEIMGYFVQLPLTAFQQVFEVTSKS